MASSDQMERLTGGDRPAVTRALALVASRPLVRASLRAVLDRIDGVAVVAEHDGADHLAVHRDDRDLALLLAPRAGAELDCLARAREELGDGHPGDLLLLCHEGDARLARAALAAGISAFLTADDDAEGFAHAVTTATHARPYVSPSVGARLASPDADDPLTDREREVLRLVALGYTSEQVGGELYLSVRTVESHRSAIIRKLDCADRRDVVSHALRLGLLR